MIYDDTRDTDNSCRAFKQLAFNKPVWRNG